MLDSVETICAEVIDGMCEQGEVDLVEALSQPFPLLVICDMMGIPRSEFRTVLDATNVILGAGDPDMLGGRDPMTAMFEAGMQLTTLMNELAEERRKDPRDDLTSALVNADRRRGHPGAARDRAVLHPARGRGERHDPHRDQSRHGPAGAESRSTPGVAGRSRRRDDDRGGGDRARRRHPSRSCGAPRRRPTRVGDHEFAEGDKVVLLYGVANRDPRVFDDPERFDVLRNPNPHVGFGGPGPHFCLGAHLARREVAVAFRQLLTRLPDIEVVGDAVPLEAMGIPLVGGIKHLPVRFTPTARRQQDLSAS